MVDQLTRVAKLLELPNLESETIQLINKRIRDELNVAPKEGELSDPVLSPLHKQAAAVLGADTVNEWLHGSGKKEGESS